MVFNRIIDFYWYYLKNLKQYEKKLIKYQGYGDRSIIKFKHQTGLKWKTILKLLEVLKIVDGLELRGHLRDIYIQNKELFDSMDTYVTHFGPIGKSGALILNQFLRCFPAKNKMILSNSDLNKLPDNASIIFLDDFIGTGNQGLEYVKNISYVLNASIKPYLFTIYGTSLGIETINEYGSRFKIKSQVILDKEKYYLLDSDNNVLLDKEKEEIRKLNTIFGIDDKSKYHLGLPFAFFYSTPDNSLGILWNNNQNYGASSGNKILNGLIPREY